MTTNSTRAGWAAEALDTFTMHTSYGRSPSDLDSEDLRHAIADLIADLGHYVDRRFRKRVPFPDLIALGIGVWSAERRCPNGEPPANDTATITIDESN